MVMVIQVDVSTLTDPDCLGPCEPGTSVVLEGLVWAESNNGAYTFVQFFMSCRRCRWIEHPRSVKKELNLWVTKFGTGP